MKKILLDTSAYTEFLSGNDKVFDILGQADTVFMSIFVLGELFYGFRGGKKEVKNKELLSRFLEKPTVTIISAGQETAEIFGFVKHELKKNGTPIPINDVWIASHTIETGATLISFDTHFKKVAGLRVWDYL
ncbi:MAG: type II toxin-antitoxin system VapC family toxin [Spirochaetota bacterium]